jgi:hypothetical protein
MFELHTFQHATSSEVKSLHLSLDSKFAEIKEGMLLLTSQINGLKEENASLRINLTDLSLNALRSLNSPPSKTHIQTYCQLYFRSYLTTKIYLEMLLSMAYRNHPRLNQQINYRTMPNFSLILSNPSCRLCPLILSPLDLVNHPTVALVYLKFSSLQKIQLSSLFLTLTLLNTRNRLTKFSTQIQLLETVPNGNGKIYDVFTQD